MPHSAQSTNTSRSSSSLNINSFNGDPRKWSSKATQKSLRSLPLAKEYSYTTNIATCRFVDLDFLGFADLWEKPTYKETYIDSPLPLLAMPIDPYLRGVEIRTNDMISGLNYEHEDLFILEPCQSFLRGIYRTEDGYEQGFTRNGEVTGKKGLSYSMERYLQSRESHERLWN